MEKHTYLDSLCSAFQSKNKSVTSSCWEYIGAVATYEQWPKLQSLQMKGQAVKSVWFVISGCLRTRYYNEKKMDNVTLWFWFPDSWAAVYSHLFSGTKSDRVIEAIEDSEVLRFSFEDLLSLRQQFPADWQVLSQLMIEGHIRDFDALLLDFVNLTAWERYEKLLSTHPEVFQMISKKDIASYLNISREELSRLRSVRKS